MISETSILAIDTSTPSCSVALTKGVAENGNVSGSLLLQGMTHSRQLLHSVDILMGELCVDWEDFSAIAVTLGPGSFTGLRIGVATAKGLAMAARLPLFGSSTLRCLAAGATPDEGDRICSILDARKKEVYAAFYRCKKNKIIKEGDHLVLPPAVLAEKLTGDELLVGDGAVSYRDIFIGIRGKQVRFAPAWLNRPSAQVLGFLAAEQFLAGERGKIGDCLPLYVRRSDAELNLEKSEKRTDDRTT